MKENIHHIIHDFFTLLFIGFSVFVLICSSIKLFCKEDLKKQFSNAIIYSVQLLRIIGLVFFLTKLISWISIFINNKFDFERLTGDYASVNIYVLSLPFILVLFSQLFWLKKIEKGLFYQFGIAIILLIISLLSGKMLNYYAVVLASLESYNSFYGGNSDMELLILLSIIWYFIKSTSIFMVLVLIYRFVKNKIK